LARVDALGPGDVVAWQATESPHALASRHPGTSGLGTGTTGLVVDGSGAPTAFYWRGGVSPQAKRTQIALGRPGEGREAGPRGAGPQCDRHSEMPALSRLLPSIALRDSAWATIDC
jgi:hypothetical protein